MCVRVLFIGIKVGWVCGAMRGCVDGFSQIAAAGGAASGVMTCETDIKSLLLSRAQHCWLPLPRSMLHTHTYYTPFLIYFYKLLFKQTKKKKTNVLVKIIKNENPPNKIFFSNSQVFLEKKHYYYVCVSAVRVNTQLTTVKSTLRVAHTHTHTRRRRVAPCTHCGAYANIARAESISRSQIHKDTARNSFFHCCCCCWWCL